MPAKIFYIESVRLCNCIKAMFLFLVYMCIERITTDHPSAIDTQEYKRVKEGVKKRKM